MKILTLDPHNTRTYHVSPRVAPGGGKKQNVPQIVLCFPAAQQNLKNPASFTSGRPAPRTASVRATSEDARVVAWTWGGLRAFLDKPGNLRTKVSL